MTQNLFDLTKQEYELERKVFKLRKKIQERTIELGIKPMHDQFGHWYEYQGKRYPSVTGRLQILKDPGLANWKMNRALEYVKATLSVLQQVPTNMDAFIDQAKLLPQKEFEGAGSIGTFVHNFREKVFRNVIEGTDWVNAWGASTDNSLPEVISGCRAIHKFVKENNYIPIACELYLADHDMEVAGTADDIGILDGKLGFMDLKTSNIGDKDSYFYQVALYVAMFEKLYRVRTKWHKILHVSKTDGTYKLIDIPDIRKRIKEAKQIIKVSSFLEKLRNEKKKIPIVV